MALSYIIPQCFKAGGLGRSCLGQSKAIAFTPVLGQESGGTDPLQGVAKIASRRRCSALSIAKCAIDTDDT